ncbi:hypothetical protein [Achromobacter aegrifaciens]|uniref:hypothetical protein n=1 Tax=Achromobacter aegrifaciens TaxID=1287736 RepID=UPI0028AD257E|nr:hypothetical protein [Achromobacter aegrifaciens]
MPHSRFIQHVLAAIGALLMALGAAVQAQGTDQNAPVATPLAPAKYCECRFSSGTYETYSVNGVCTVQRYAAGHKCEYGFSGIGANPAVLTSILGQGADHAQLQSAAKIVTLYLAFAESGDTSALSESRFIEGALPVLARGSLFRQAVVSAELPVKEIDSEIVIFSSKYSNVIAEVFQGKRPPLSVTWTEGFQFEIGRGYVLMDYKQKSQLLVLFFSDAKR